MRKLESVSDLLEALREELGLESDRQIGKHIGVPQQTISNWRIGTRIPQETHALAIAKALKVSPALVLTIAAAERSVDEESRKAWSMVAKHIARVGLPSLAALALISSTFATPAKAATSADSPAMYIMAKEEAGAEAGRPNCRGALTLRRDRNCCARPPDDLMVPSRFRRIGHLPSNAL